MPIKQYRLGPTLRVEIRDVDLALAKATAWRMRVLVAMVRPIAQLER